MLTLEEMEARLLVPGAPPERWLAWKRHFEHGAPAELVRLAREVELDAKRVLDVGCGYGTHLLHFAPSSVGIDRLADHVAFARSIGLRSEVRDVDTLGWNLGLGDFDLVWIANLLGEIEDPSALLASLPTVLAPKGRIVLFERVWPENPRTARAVARCLPGGREAYDALEAERRLTDERFATLCASAGLEVEREWSHTVGSAALGRLLHGLLVPRTIVLRPRRAAARPEAPAAAGPSTVAKPRKPAPARGEKKRKTDAEPPHVLAPHRPDPVRRAADVERRRGDPDRASERPAPRRNGGRRERA